MKIGTSLSGCLTSIQRGNAALGEVVGIMTSTAYTSREQMIDGVYHAMRGKHVDQHIANACALWDSGRIYQPSTRFFEGNMPRPLWIEVNVTT